MPWVVVASAGQSTSGQSLAGTVSRSAKGVAVGSGTAEGITTATQPVSTDTACVPGMADGESTACVLGMADGESTACVLGMADGESTSDVRAGFGCGAIGSHLCRVNVAKALVPC